jgi:hypothetical protein
MPETYLNCYALLEKVRIQLNEHSTAFMQGTDVSGKFNNTQIIDGINSARKYIFNILFKRIPYVFETEVALTGVASVYTLPADFGILRYFKDSDGNQIYPIEQNFRRKTSETGSEQRYYRRGNTLVLDKAGITEVCTLIYYKKCRDLDQCKATAGAATSITLATTAKKIVDYYNGMTIENVTQDWTDTISDYATTRVATITATAAANDYYGIVCDMPEAFHHLYVPRAVFEITGNYPVVQDRPSVGGTKALGWTIFNENLMAAIQAFAGNDQDGYPEDVWCEYSDGRGGNSNPYNIPGH